MSNKQRIQFDLPDKSIIRLKHLREVTEASSYAEVVKNALRLYEIVIQETENGNSFAVIDKEKNAKEFVIF